MFMAAGRVDHPANRKREKKPARILGGDATDWEPTMASVQKSHPHTTELAR